MGLAKISTQTGETASDINELKRWGLYGVALLIAVLALLPRLDGYDYHFGKYLWAEDGTIFLNQSEEMGLSAIITPYAGYLNFYPRLIAEISRSFDLLYRPAVLLSGWIVAYFILVHSLVRANREERGSIFTLLPLIALSSLQPNYGHVFFNITNSQWMLGAALFLYALTGSNRIPINQRATGIFLFPLTLTGPFSIILSPILVLKIFIKKDWHQQKYTYLTVFFGASIQLTSLLLSERVTSGTINKDPWEWIVAFLKIACFGANNVWTILAAWTIWSLIVYLISKSANKNQKIDSTARTSVMLLIGAFLVIFAGLVSHKHSPGAIVALGGGNRYTWIPYILIVTAAILLSKGQKVISTIVIALFSFIWFTNFHKVGSLNLQFEAFSKFSKVDKVIIPIRPQWPTFPGWYIAGKPRSNTAIPAPTKVELTPESIVVSGLTADFSNEHLKIVSTGGDPVLVFTEKFFCPDHSHAALNIYLTREKEGWMQLFWSGDGDFNKHASLRRWYPSGSVKAQFAFPAFPNGIYLRFDSMEHAGSASIEKIELYCLQ